MFWCTSKSWEIEWRRAQIGFGKRDIRVKIVLTNKEGVVDAQLKDNFIYL